MLNLFEQKIKKEISFTPSFGEVEKFLDEGIIVFDEEMQIIYFNEKVLSFFKGKSGFAKFCLELASLTFQTQKPVRKNFSDLKTSVFFSVASNFSETGDEVYLFLQDKTAECKLLTMGKDFVSNASHELKTPLTVIRGYAETLNDISLSDKKLVNSVVEKIVKTSKRLEKIIFDLLTLAEIDNASFVQCDLKKTVKNCMEMISSVYANIEISSDIGVENFFISGSSGLLELAVRNILENAVKYSQEKNPKISVSLKKINKKICLEIKDFGIGISKKDLPFIFDRFFTVDRARSRKRGGVGLGLSIVKNIIERHGGNIKVISKVNEGTSFKVFFSQESYLQ